MLLNHRPFRSGVVIAGIFWCLGFPQRAIGQTDPVQSPGFLAQVPVLTPRPDPNRDRQIQPLPLPTPVPPSTEPVLETPPTPTPTPTPPGESVTIAVTKVQVEGSTILSPADLKPITEKVEGKSVSLEELRQVADAITQIYLNQGYITSRAVLADQTIANDGIVRIQVIEGAIEKIEIEGNQRVRESYIRSRIRLGTRTPLNRDALEDQLRLLKVDPLFTTVEASLRPGETLGKSVLVVRVAETPSLSGLIGVDNYSPPAVGAVRLGGAIAYRNLTGYGDDLSASVYHTTTSGATTADFIYRLPVNAMNGTVQFRFSPSRNEITDPSFSALGIEGNSQLYEVSFRQPIIRTPRQELALSVGFSAQNGETFLFDDIPFSFTTGPDNGNSRTRVFKLAQDYVIRDPQGAWAFRSQLSFGAGILGATINDSPTPDGRFFSWLGQIQRVQRFGENHLVIAQADIQLTPDTLLPSQQFVIGGGQSLRGYRQNIRSGDNGFRFSLEDRITVLRDESGIPLIQLAPFIDLGSVWNRSDNPNAQPEKRFLAGAGLGLLWQPVPKLNIRLDGALPFINLPDRGNDAQDRAFYFSVTYQP